ncbi:hypothetical protein ACFQ0T_00350 [Kitasatospora gansuensis]
MRCRSGRNADAGPRARRRTAVPAGVPPPVPHRRRPRSALEVPPHLDRPHRQRHHRPPGPHLAPVQAPQPPDAQGRYSPYERWYLHADDGHGQPHPDLASASLGRNRVNAQRLAELTITGWENSHQLRPGDGVQLWRRTDGDGTLVPLDELLAGRHR